MRYVIFLLIFIPIKKTLSTLHDMFANQTSDVSLILERSPCIHKIHTVTFVCHAIAMRPKVHLPCRCPSRCTRTDLESPVTSGYAAQEIAINQDGARALLRHQQSCQVPMSVPSAKASRPLNEVGLAASSQNKTLWYVGTRFAVA